MYTLFQVLNHPVSSSWSTYILLLFLGVHGAIMWGELERSIRSSINSLTYLWCHHPTRCFLLFCVSSGWKIHIPMFRPIFPFLWQPQHPADHQLYGWLGEGIRLRSAQEGINSLYTEGYVLCHVCLIEILILIFRAIMAITTILQHEAPEGYPFSNVEHSLGSFLSTFSISLMCV